MIIRDIDQLAGSDRDIVGEGWRSRRLLRRDDGVNFSLHFTELEAGVEMELEYANHYEANYCMSGEGEVVDVAGGETYQLRAGSMYTLDQHDRHILRTKTAMQLMCVFWPALVGNESHDPSGGYPAALEDAETTPRR